MAYQVYVSKSDTVCLILWYINFARIHLLYLKPARFLQREQRLYNCFFSLAYGKPNALNIKDSRGEKFILFTPP